MHAYWHTRVYTDRQTATNRVNACCLIQVTCCDTWLQSNDMYSEWNGLTSAWRTMTWSPVGHSLHCRHFWALYLISSGFSQRAHVPHAHAPPLNMHTHTCHYDQALPLTMQTSSAVFVVPAPQQQLQPTTTTCASLPTKHGHYTCDEASPLVRQTSSAVVPGPALRQQLWPRLGAAAAAQPASCGGASGSADAGSLQRHLCSPLQHPGCSLPWLLLRLPTPPACPPQPAKYRVAVTSRRSGCGAKSVQRCPTCSLQHLVVYPGCFYLHTLSACQSQLDKCWQGWNRTEHLCAFVAYILRVLWPL